ncbi:unnamed protein product, partial [Choristocarpus tenellus]
LLENLRYNVEINQAPNLHTSIRDSHLADVCYGKDGKEHVWREKKDICTHGSVPR